MADRPVAQQLPFDEVRPTATAEPMEVEVVRSARRRKTLSASVVDGRLRVLIPASLSKADEREWVETARRRLAKKLDPRRIDLEARARVLARRYGLPEPETIRWVDNQERRWGSCTPDDGSIRISSRLLPFPAWVVDAVVVHELAHLVVLQHSPAFYELVARYPRMERATGFLIAKGLADPDDEDALG